MWGIMPVCSGDGKEGNGGLSRFRSSYALINPDRAPGTPGPDQIGHDIAPLSGSAGCQGGLQYFNQNTKGCPVRKRRRARPAVRLKRKVSESGCRGNRSGMIQFILTQTRRSRTGRHKRQPEDQKRQAGAG